MFDGCPADAAVLRMPKDIMSSIVHVESANNPFAIGVVGDKLQRQPKNLAEATLTAERLQKLGKNFSVGLAQVNLSNFKRTGITNWSAAFDRCSNLTAGAKIFLECHKRSGDDYRKAISCYYSGNFTTGFLHGYVQKVTAHMRQSAAATTPDFSIPKNLSLGSIHLGGDSPFLSNAMIPSPSLESGLRDKDNAFIF